MKDVSIVFLISFLIASGSAFVYIPLLRKLKVRQTIREDGPKTHKKKENTPTIGGLIFLTPLIILSIYLYVNGKAPNILSLLFVTIAFALVGFLDDLLKVLKKNKNGLLPYQKMALLFLVSLIFSYFISQSSDLVSVVNLRFFGFYTQVDLSYAFIPISILVLLSSSNAVNLTDGLDGLCGGASFFVFMFLIVAASLYEPNIDVRFFAGILAGSLLAFLLFNYNPARVFMGDTGSLALGGAIGASFIVLRIPHMLLIAGLLFVIEALSVILQVFYFKVSKGKRLFKMAPIHHHFEKSGWSEKKIVHIFWIFTFITLIIAYLALKI